MDSNIKSNNNEKKNQKILGKRTRGDFDEDTAVMVDVNSLNKSINSTDDDSSFMEIVEAPERKRRHMLTRGHSQPSTGNMIIILFSNFDFSKKLI